MSARDTLAAITNTPEDAVAPLIRRLMHAGDGNGAAVSEQEIVAALSGASLTGEQATVLWEYFADADNSFSPTLPIVTALAQASNTAKAHEAMWSELAGMSRGAKRGDKDSRARSLIGIFEANRDRLLPLIGEVRETQGAGDDIIELMASARVFGGDVEESVARVAERIPAAIARTIERQRGLGKAVRWEYAAYESIVKWKNARLVPGGAKEARTLAQLDAAGEDFIVVFNCLHTLDSGFREVIVRGLGPVEIFNAVVAGEKELYRLGTSGYRSYLHPAIMRGIAESGSFEAFLERATLRRFGDAAVRDKGRRGVVFLRVVGSFGLLDGVLETVRDRQRLIEEAIASLGDASAFEDNSAVLIDVLTRPTRSRAAADFKAEFLERLYSRYRSERDPRLAAVYGSMLSVYQSIANDHRDRKIDTAFALDGGLHRVAFERLFSADADGGFTSRMFMRFDETEDDVETFQQFGQLMTSLGAVRIEQEYHVVYRIVTAERRIEIFANRPDALGLRLGVEHIADALAGARVETVIGRGHTSIIAPLQKDARRLLGERVREVAFVVVGACGGDASVRDLIGTFGYIPFLTTKSTGRQAINNAVVKTYIATLTALSPGERLDMTDMVERATARFMDMSEDLREDARLYQINRASVLIAQLFEAHVRQAKASGRQLASE